ncbi:50S ribosomal protein L25/general stress protein Ctc [Ancylomarina euxinus]|uniref:Large ribosomal subunit protein bL25 n=1 Tax=Ancylomarina euxinus TaxID=2283627 RepID=A0A425XY26_9BACT|nr:50S ribosomal protein L25/general stress protein Ctc [Ancylomarina euxinus]MCZ4695912.1 50S ribosomal protein L25/general stress protein Ctc [Ancylomarina euxinus]MUP16288.1 50S ribosomal protein L25/general stress protein Ctc [Ancylomarina euxinus]RRG19659.1 50S ribosomal protein L25/general stress protein Ctc [Ancylomarina euxinus]
MKTLELKGSLRTDLGKKATKALRRAELVPCELYGGEENIHFSVSEKDLNKLLFTPEVFIIKFDIDGKVFTSVMREVQFHPVNDKALHVDFFQVTEDKAFEVEVPVKVEGFAEGVKAGGKLAVNLRKLKVKAFMKDLPEALPIDVTNLGLSKSIQVGALSFENLELLNAKSAVVVQVKLTRAARAAAMAAQGK